MSIVNSFFYCYDKDLMKYLRYEKGIQFICTGLHLKSKDQFWQFERSELLYTSLNEFLDSKKPSVSKCTL